MAIYTIGNEHFHVSVNSYGAQLIEFLGLTTGRQYLWGADESVWGKTSPVLFPYIGRVRDSYIKVGEAVYPMTKHGFARNSEFQLVWSTDTMLRFELSDNDYTRSLYPFPFRFTVIYRLSGSKLTTRFEVENTGTEEMYFALGGHTGFSTEIDGSKLGDYRLIFDRPIDFVSDKVDLKKGLLSGEQENLGHGTEVRLGVDVFEPRDTLVFREIESKSVRLVSDKHAAEIRVDYADFPNLAIWAMKGTDRFVCIEPWIAQTDFADTKHTLAKKSGFVRLEGGKTFVASYDITITE